MTKLSVNINKFATIRNARGGNNPDLLKVARDCQLFGADGITVHPRPDERHITTSDVYNLKDVITTEYNIEGYPDERYLRMVRDVRPHQATLVPDPPGILTSNTGWNIAENASFLKEVIKELKSYGARVSIFVNAIPSDMDAAAKTGTDRIELYTGEYANSFGSDPAKAIAPFVETAKAARRAGLGINAGHDLDLHNLRYFHNHLEGLLEVSIGHALVCDAIYLGLENTIKLYQRALR